MRPLDADKLLAALDDLRKVHLEDGTYDLVEQVRYATAVKVIEEMEEADIADLQRKAWRYDLLASKISKWQREDRERIAKTLCEEVLDE